MNGFLRTVRFGGDVEIKRPAGVWWFEEAGMGEF